MKKSSQSLSRGSLSGKHLGESSNKNASTVQRAEEKDDEKSPIDISIPQLQEHKNLTPKSRIKPKASRKDSKRRLPPKPTPTQIINGKPVEFHEKAIVIFLKSKC